MITPSKPRLRSATVEAFLRGMPDNPPHNALRNAVNRAIAEGSPIIENKPRRTMAYDIVVRRLANGSDYSMRLFAFDAIEAGNRAMERVRFNIGMSRAKYIELNSAGIAVFRVVSCEVSPDQSRPVG